MTTRASEYRCRPTRPSLGESRLMLPSSEWVHRKVCSQRRWLPLLPSRPHPLRALLPIPKGGGALLAKHAEEVVRRHGSSASSMKQVRTGATASRTRRIDSSSACPRVVYVLQRSVVQS